MVVTESQIWNLLDQVKDPEIPVLSLVDLGVITKVSIEGDNVTVDMTPTFSGCPAMDYMKNNVIEVLENEGIEKPHVNVSFKNSWNSDKINEKGRKALKEFGLAPPPHKSGVIVDIEILNHVACPYCESKNTELKSPFGPTLCRSMHYCNNCNQAFEQFKPV